MLGRPPRSTLFPTRRSSDLYGQVSFVNIVKDRSGRISTGFGFLEMPVRSEEHTSELQSHSDLVCRLLLEKKKAPIGASDIHKDQFEDGFERLQRGTPPLYAH